MIELNKVYNEDCLETMKRMTDKSIDLVLTSPPYNTGKRKEYYSSNIKNGKRIYSKEKRYDNYNDNMTDEEYIKWSLNIFNSYSKILKKDGCILYNLSYGNESPDIMWLLISEIINKTDFMVADNIIWKKKTAVPNSTSKNKLTRICEYIFVFVKKDDYKTYSTNKRVLSTSKKGQDFYEVFYNFVEAKNNDGKNNLNKATFSEELVEKLLRMYATRNNDFTIYDSFSGTGTTVKKAKEMGFNFIGSEISKEQNEYTNKRLSQVQGNLF